MKNWKLENIENTARENPDTFFIPFKHERDNQKFGDKVRLHFINDNPQNEEPRAERMWVRITKEKGLFSNYKGILDNKPLFIIGLNEGDEIEFNSKNIAQTILKKDSSNWIDSGNKHAIISNKCLEPKGCVRFLYREQTEKENDSGWRMFCGNEDDEYVNNPDNLTILNIGYLLDKDPTLLTPLKGETGSVFERDEIKTSWKIVDDWSPKE